MSDAPTPTDPALPPALLQQVSAQGRRDLPGGFAPLLQALQSRYADGLLAVIVYGSSLQSGRPLEGVADFYLIVRDYRSAYRQHHLRLLNRVLPPNVFYLEVRSGEQVLRAKYAVISLAAFERGCRDWFHPYLWARFAQPARIPWAVDGAVRARLDRSMAVAVLTFLQKCLPALGSRELDVEGLWSRCLSLTYAAELRAESTDRGRWLASLNLADYRALTAAALPALGGRLRAVPGGRYRCQAARAEQLRSRWRWRLCRWQGRVLSILRLTKAVFTFHDALDYAAWKLERHTGVHIEVTPAMRRHPLLRGYRVLWQLLRRGVIR